MFILLLYITKIAFYRYFYTYLFISLLLLSTGQVPTSKYECIKFTEKKILNEIKTLKLTHII